MGDRVQDKPRVYGPKVEVTVGGIPMKGYHGGPLVDDESDVEFISRLRKKLRELGLSKPKNDEPNNG